MRDGKVMVLALGPESSVQELGQWLSHGPPSAQVAEVEESVEQADEWRHLPDFRTR